MLCLDRELHLGRLARHLGAVVKLDDPHARHFAYRRAGAGPVDPRDDLHAAAIARARRRAQATVPPDGPPTPCRRPGRCGRRSPSSSPWRWPRPGRGCGGAR